MPRSLPSLAFTVAVVGAALAVGLDGRSKAAPPAPAAPASTVVEIVSSDEINLHRVAWLRATIPGRVCDVRRPVHLRAGKAFVGSHLEVNDGWHRVVYGDLDADGADEAAVSVACSNGGGTADSVWAYAIVLFKAGAVAPRVLAIIRPQHHRAHMRATLMEVSIRPGWVDGHEAFYGPNDGTCCPSGRAVSSWLYFRGRLRLAATRVTREPE